MLILAALAGVVLLGWSGSPFHKPLRKGLDLQGGLEVVLKAQPPKGHQLTSSDLDRSVTIMRNRVDKLGVSEPDIRKQGSNQIVIELAGVHDPAAAAKLIGKTAQLELYDLEPALVPPSRVGDRRAGRDDEPLRPALARAVVGAEGHAEPVRAVQEDDEDDEAREEEEDDDDVAPDRRPDGRRCTATRRPATRACSTRTAARCRRAAKVLPVPAQTVVITLLGDDDVRLPGRTSNGLPPAGQTDYYLFKHGAYPSDR